MSLLLQLPDPTEHAPYAATYLAATAAALDGGGHQELTGLLLAQQQAWPALLDGVVPSMAAHAYAPGKWTLAESLVHVADTERVFAYRLLRVARGDTTPMPGFDQDAWVPLSGAGERTLPEIVAELTAVREATLALVRSLDDAALMRVGVASGHPVSARALVWMIAGHMAHHLTITRERYLSAS